MELRLVLWVVVSFSLDHTRCEITVNPQTNVETTTIEILSATLDQIPMESQLPLTSESQLTTEAEKSTPLALVTNKIQTTKKPSCRIVYKTVSAPVNHPSSNQKIIMACTVCNFGGYKESCVYTDTHVVKNVGQTSKSTDVTMPLVQESRQSVTVQSVTHKNPKNYIPKFVTTATSVSTAKEPKEDEVIDITPDRADMESKEEMELESQQQSQDTDDDESVEDTKEDNTEDRETVYFKNFIPKYSSLDYDPNFYESHDAAANIFYKVPFTNHRSSSPYDDEEDSSEETIVKPTRYSYHHAMPGFKKLREILPDAEPIDVDRVKPRKRQKTIEYNEETVFSSDDNDKILKKDKSHFSPTDSQGERTITEDAYEPSGTSRKFKGRRKDKLNGEMIHHNTGHSHENVDKAKSHQYKPPFDMPAFDTKDCEVIYKESLNGGPKMKCMNCKDKHNAYSEECGVEYEEPTKHREVYYNSHNYNPRKKDAKKMVHGTEHHPYYYPYHGPKYRSRKKHSESKLNVKYMPYEEYYYFYT